MAVLNTDTSYPRNGPRVQSMSTLNMSKAERERFVQPYLPPPRVRRSTVTSRSRSRRKHRSKPIRTFLKSKLYFLVYFLIHIFFGIYLRIRQAYHAVVDRILAILYYHHRTPELIRKDVKALRRLPEHLSAVLSLKKDEDALEILMDEVAELAAWTSCAGIPALSIYEKTGILKSYIPALYEIITSKFSTYYGHPSNQPTLHLFAPHHPLYTPPSSSAPKSNQASLTLLLLSATDGRDTLVDLTKTLAEMAQHGKLSPQDISTKLIDAELSEMMSTPTPSKSPSPSSSPSSYPATAAPPAGDNDDDGKTHAQPPAPLIKSEPDLLLVFGPMVKLDGFPPWQVRLTEIYCTGDQSSSITGDGETVEYQRFLQGLWSYAGAEMRFGR